MIEVLQAETQVTIQGFGRPCPNNPDASYGGAVDKYALLLANRLLNNPDNSLVLEFTAGKLQLLFKTASWIALTGADFDARVENRPLRSGWRAKINAGERLFINGPKTGVYGYLAILGGVADLSGIDDHSEIDDHDGMAAEASLSLSKLLKVNDSLFLTPTKNRISRPIGVVQRANDGILRALPGSELDLFTPSSRKSFWANEWQLAAQSSRSAAFLEGEPLSTVTHTRLAPRPNQPGTVQVSEQGQMSISLADTQSKGDSPVIARVIEADLWKVAQRQPGQGFRFEHVSPNQVESANYEWQQYFERLARRIARNS